MRQRLARFSLVAATLAVALAGSANDARAQAWVGAQGSLDISLGYNFAASDVVVGDEIEFGPDNPDSLGGPQPLSGVTTHQLTLGAEYAPIRNLAISASLPLAFLKYTGDQVAYPHIGGGCMQNGVTVGCYDDGSFHPTLTDLRVGVRYQLLDEPVAIAPHIAGSAPVGDYETIGNANGGRHLFMAHFGLGIGTIIGDAAYVHAMYEFSLVQKYDRDEVRTNELQKHGQNKSDASFTVGYKLLDYRLDIHLDAQAKFTHGGIDLDDLGMVSQPEFNYHDAILKEETVLAGGGVAYQITNSLGVSLDARLFLTGRNTQKANVFALGLTYSPLSGYEASSDIAADIEVDSGGTVEPAP